MRFRRRLAPKSSVDLIPMIDVTINILIFFMVSTTFTMTPAITLNLPESSSSDVTPVTTLTLTIQGKDVIFLNKESLTLTALDRRLKGYTTEDREKIQSVLVQGDEAVPYSLMIRILDILRHNGFSSISLKTRDDEAPR